MTYWDTADTYLGGRSEKGIGKYFSKFPKDRKKVFLTTKGGAIVPETVEESLKRLNTSHIDLYLLHGINSMFLIKSLPTTRKIVEQMKSEGKIRFFGFSTHQNMEECMLDAAKLGWIDAIMFSYNFRIMNRDKMKRALEECYNAGIALTAMKTQASTGVFPRGFLDGFEKDTPSGKINNIMAQYQKRGFTLEQASLKAVWDDSRISSICSHMSNMSIFNANVAAANDETKLSFQEKQLMEEYANKTASHYCTGCAHICELAINSKVPISDVMRYLMYDRSYGEPKRARRLFKELPSEVKKRVANLDYRTAEQKCPQKMQISRLMREAALELV